MKKFKLIASIIVMFFVSPQLLAWQVAKLKGEATISRSGERIPVEVGQPLVDSDVVSTAAGSRVLIEEGNSKIWIGASTKMEVAGIKNRRSGRSEPETLNILTGKIRSLIKNSDKSKRQYKFKTPTAVAGVRGTEFFIETTEEGEFFCTLDGSIEVKTAKGESFVVDEGKGLRLALGEVPDLSGTSSLLVDRWVAETSFEDNHFVPQAAYSDQRNKEQWENRNIFYGGFGSIYYCGKENSDLDDSTNDENMDCYRYYLSPFLQIGEGRKLFLRPALVGTYATTYGLIDEVPATSSKKKSAATIAEAYAEDSYAGWRLRLGLQDVEWADGILLSRRMAAIEPLSHLALTARTQVKDHELELLAGPGLEDSNALQGHSQIATAGVKLRLKNNRGELYALHTNFGAREGRSVFFHGQEIMNYGYFVHNKKGNWDYRVSAIHQDLGIFYKTVGGARTSSSATSTDVGVGRQLNTARPARVSLRHIKSSRNFVPVQEDFYTLSQGMIVSHRSNLEQWRARLDLQINESQVAALEYLLSIQQDPNGFRTFIAGATEKDEEFGEEIALTHTWQINSRFEWTNTLWTFEPKSDLLGEDSAFGLNSRLIFSL